MSQGKDDEGDYGPFYLGEVRVVQASKSCFMAYGEYLPGGLEIYRGQVHIDSFVESDAGAGTRGKLTVTRWWALSRKLKEAPRRGKWKRPERSPLDEKRAMKPMRAPSSLPAGPAAGLPAGFTKR